MFKKQIMILVILLSLAGSAFAQKSIVVAVPAAIPPMAFVGEDGKLTGYSVDYIKAVAEAGGFAVELKNIPWSGIFASLVKGEFDAICGAVSITEKRKKVVDFTQPYFELWPSLAVRQDSSVTSLAELKGKRVGGKIGSTTFQALTEKAGVEAVSYRSVKLLLDALKAKEVEGIVYDEVMVHYYIEKEYKDSLKIASLIQTEKEDLLGIAVKKGNSEVLDLLNKGMTAIKGSDTEQAIRKKWLSDRTKQ